MLIASASLIKRPEKRRSRAPLFNIDERLSLIYSVDFFNNSYRTMKATFIVAKIR